jgi:TPR repeat protein
MLMDFCLRAQGRLRRLKTSHALSVAIIVLLSYSVSAQPRKSHSFRTSPPGPSVLIVESDPSAQLLEGFILIQKANSGDPVAEQEVGLRYLFGRDFPPDTVKAAFWIKKAAEQGLLTAKYNLAILTNNGWGTDWNPFEAFRLFRDAAKGTMMEAQYMVGLTYVDNLVVPRNWNTAYRFLSESAAQGFKPAKEVLHEFVKRGIRVDTVNSARKPLQPDTNKVADKAKGKPDTAWTPIFLDLQRDPPTAVNDTTLLKDVYREANITTRYSLEMPPVKLHRVEEDTGMAWIIEAANAGNPESLTLIGRLYEEGVGFDRDLILAAEYYIRAIRFDSPRASQLLWKLVQKDEFRNQMDERSKRNDPVALFVWAGLTALRYDATLNDQQALELLQKSADLHHVPALIELGLCFYQGRWVSQDRNAAIALWQKAVSDGSEEAKVRIAAAMVTGDFSDHAYGVNLPILFNAAREGVLLAQLALAYCYEHGYGLQENKGEAARLYRICAERGSQNAFQSLRRMYDEIRPKDKEFAIDQ